MRKNTQILPGVKSIGCVDCLKLVDNVALRGICRMLVPVMTDVQMVEVFDEAECSCKTERDNRQNTDTASLKFLAPELLPIHLHLGFVVTDVNDKQYLIGAKEPPYPQVKIEHRCGLPSGDGAGFFYEVTHIALKSLVQCTATLYPET